MSETLSHSQRGTLILAGTPKWIDNPLEAAFQQSTGHEWHAHCEVCCQDILLTEHTLGPGHLACPICQNELHPARGHWIARNPTSVWGDGFAVSHLMVPWLSVNDILERQGIYDRVTFLNEVLGQPATLGDHVVSREEVERCCDDRPMAQSWQEVPAAFRRQLVLGLDWGGGSNSGTVAVIGYAHRDRTFTIVRLDRWRPHEDPSRVLEGVLALCLSFRVCVIAADDNGNGSVYNRILVDQLRPHWKEPKLWGILYGADTLPPIAHGVVPRWTVGRTPSIGGLFTRIKLGLIRFPRVAESGSFLDELTCELAEYDDELRIVRYTKPEDRCDDCLHALNYAEMLAMKLYAAARR